MIAKKYGERARESFSYNIRGWVTGIQGPYFKQTLYYNNGAGTSCFNGNISSMTWKAGAETTIRGYKFTYDGLSRLKNAVYGEGDNISINANRFNEQVTGYDRQGNILGLSRYGQTGASTYGVVDNLNLTYNGNQLKAVKDNGTANVYGNGFEFKDGSNLETEYVYDENGNLTKDLNKKITLIQYNWLDLPSKVQFEGGNSIVNLYAADGTKFRTTRVTGSNTVTTDFCNNAIYENGVLVKVLTQDGYMTVKDAKLHYFIQDHLGNNRVVVDKDGKVEETNHYYPFGGVFTSSTNIQPYKYNGKELDRTNGLDWYDYGARRYDATIGRWHGVDPMAEKYFSLSTYNYCGNNPISFIDPNGMDYWSTNNQNEIRNFINTISGGYGKNIGFFEVFNFSSWNHSTDADFLANLTFNDEKNVFYYSSTYWDPIDGLTVMGITIPALARNDNWAAIKRKNPYKYPDAGRLNNVYPEYDLFFASTKSGWNIVKNIFISMFRPFSTTNTFDAGKSGFAQGRSDKEKMGKSKGNMSGNHDVQNKQVEDLSKKYNLDKKRKKNFT